MATCLDCNGDGHGYMSGSQCVPCAGSGQVPDAAPAVELCVVCTGEGCDTCEGTGRARSLEGDDTDFLDIGGAPPCSECGGSGEIESWFDTRSPCHSCTGRAGAADYSTVDLRELLRDDVAGA